MMQPRVLGCAQGSGWPSETSRQRRLDYVLGQQREVVEGDGNPWAMTRPDHRPGPGCLANLRLLRAGQGSIESVSRSGGLLSS